MTSRIAKAMRDDLGKEADNPLVRQQLNKDTIFENNFILLTTHMKHDYKTTSRKY